MNTKEIAEIREKLVHRNVDEIGYLMIVEETLAGARKKKREAQKVGRVIDIFCDVRGVSRSQVKIDRNSIGAHQVRVFYMAGGGFLGRFAAEQPFQFYIDDRVGDLPYTRKAIYRAVKELTARAEQQGLDPSRLPEMPRFYHCGTY